MKLTDVDLNDKSEVSAAHALLAAILGVSELTITSRVGEISQTASGSVRSLTPAGVIEKTDAQPMQDAAAVFGANPLPDTLAPSTAGVGLPLTVLGGLPGISIGQPAGNPAPAHFIAQAALVPGGAAEMNQAAGPTNPAPGVELDARGLPWDGRIHASTKTKTKPGAWTALRGLNDATKVAAIEAELRASVAQSAAPLATVPPSPASVVGLPGIALPGSSVPPVGAAGPAVADPVTFEQLMPRVTQATIAGVLPPTALQQVCGLLDLPSVVALQTNPAYVPHAWAQLKAAYPALR